MTTPDTPADAQAALIPERSTTYWQCERCGATGIIDHDKHAGVWEVYTRLMDAHFAAHADCDERYYILVSKDPITAPRAADADGRRSGGE